MKKQQAMELISVSLGEGAELRTVVAPDCSAAIIEAADLITTCLRARGKLLLFGNGGSAADPRNLSAASFGNVPVFQRSR